VTKPLPGRFVPEALAANPTLVGELVVLRPFTADDAEAMAQIMADPEVVRLTGSANSSSAHTPVDLQVAREWYGTRQAQTDRLDLAVVDAATGELVGEVVLNELESPNRSMNFRTLVGPAGRGRGLGTEACRLIVGYGFDQVGLHRVRLDVFDFNPRARRAYEKVGFVHEGTVRDELFFDGEWIDSHLMSILESEWAAHRGHPGTSGQGA